MAEPASQLETLLDLETRHEELLDQLAELDAEVAQVLRRWQGGREDPDPAPETPPFWLGTKQAADR